MYWLTLLSVNNKLQLYGELACRNVDLKPAGN